MAKNVFDFNYIEHEARENGQECVRFLLYGIQSKGNGLRLRSISLQRRNKKSINYFESRLK